MNIFCISHTFAPLANAEAIQAARVLEQLRLNGHEVIVFTAAPNELSSPIGDGTSLFNGEVRRYAGREYRLGMRIARRAMPFVASLPDAHVFWYRTARKAALRAAARSSADIIYSRSQPFSSALTGSWVARKLGVPHVANFSDPWISNPFRRAGKISRILNANMERGVVRNVEHLVTTTQWLKDDLMVRYGEWLGTKISVLPHAFDRLVASGKDPVKREGFVAGHIGNLYGERSAVPLVVSASKLLSEGLLPEGFKIRLIGFVEKEEAAAIMSADIHDLVEMTGLLSYEESLEEMMSADLLISIDGPGEASHPFLPSKLIEYIGAGKRILALTEHGSASHSIVGEIGGKIASPAKVDEISAGLREATAMGEPNYSAEVSERYSSESVARQLEEIFEQITN